MDITIYITATGKIKANANLTTEELALTLLDGESYIEGSYQPDMYKIVDGAAVQLETSEDTAQRIRDSRLVKLRNSDWTQVPDSPLSDAKKAEWATYRQALRDMPANNTSVTNIDDATWPTEPA